MILVTGGAGFIGSNLVAALADRGERVSVSDWLGTGDKWRNLARHELDELVAPERLASFLERRREDVEFIFHMGAVSSTTEQDVDLIADTNLRLSQEVWRWCRERRVPLIYASSAATYGDGGQGFEDDGTPDGLARLRPLNPYGWSKHAFDRWVAREVRTGNGAPPGWVGLKFFNVYGPNEFHKEEMRSLVTKAFPAASRGEPTRLFRSHHPDYPDGGQMRDFVYVEDCVDAMLWLRDNIDGASGIFNLGTGRAQTFLELIGALYNAVDQELKVEWVDTPEELRDRYQYYTQADMTKLRQEGYDRPFRPVEEGVRHYVTHFLATEDPYR